MIDGPREQFLRSARIELNASHCLVLSPFVAARDFSDLLVRLEIFGDDIKSAFATVCQGLQVDYSSKTSEDAISAMVLAETATDCVFQTKYGTNLEQALGKVFLEKVGAVQETLRNLEEPVRTRSITVEQKTDIIDKFRDLDAFVSAIPGFYENTPVTVQEEQNFIFRPTQQLTV